MNGGEDELYCDDSVPRRTSAGLFHTGTFCQHGLLSIKLLHLSKASSVVHETLQPEDNKYEIHIKTHRDT